LERESEVSHLGLAEALPHSTDRGYLVGYDDVSVTTYPLSLASRSKYSLLLVSALETRFTRA